MQNVQEIARYGFAVFLCGRLRYCCIAHGVAHRSDELITVLFNNKADELLGKADGVPELIMPAWEEWKESLTCVT